MKIPSAIKNGEPNGVLKRIIRGMGRAALYDPSLARSFPLIKGEKIMKRSLGAIAVAVSIVCLPITLANSAETKNVDLPKLMNWTAYTVGTSAHGQAVAIGNMLRTNYGVTVRILPARNDISRLKPLLSGRARVCSCGVGMYLAQEGLRAFAAKEWGPQPARIMMMSYSPIGFMMATQNDRGINKISDLAGKRVSYVRSGATQNDITEAKLASAGLSWKDVKRVEFGSYVDSINGLVNGQVDSIIALTVSPAMRKIAASPDGIKWLPLPHTDKNAWSKFLTAAPYFIKTKVRFGAGIKKGSTIDGAMYPYPLLLSVGDFSSKHAYSLTKAMVDRYDDYKANAPGARGWSIKAQKLQWVLPYHEGSVRYFKEAGIWSSAAQAHNNALIARQDVLVSAWKKYKAANSRLESDAYKTGWMKARADALKGAGLPLHAVH